MNDSHHAGRPLLDSAGKNSGMMCDIFSQKWHCHFSWFVKRHWGKSVAKYGNKTSPEITIPSSVLFYFFLESFLATRHSRSIGLLSCCRLKIVLD
jgi:hypothetical protein